MMALFVIAFIGAAASASAGHYVASLVIVTGASLGGLAVLLLQPRGGRH
jgi:hypothetical protein